MIISHSHKFIFIKTRKTAGSAIEIALSKFLGPNDIITSSPLEGIEARNCPDELKNRYGFYDGHQGQDYIRKEFPNEWRNYYKFTSERHPVDKVLSGYRWSMVLNDKYRAIGIDVKKPKPNSLSEFLNSGRTPCDWTKYAKNDVVLVDTVIEHKKINDGYRHVCNEIGLPQNSLPEAVKKTSADVFELSANDLNVIRHSFSKEIEHFNYEI
ncbi:sulfotransferase family 2 domain-containing protein [uncultured Roseibium sp.]|uniref:sulfotransferase family 2 domain-containing protein n=1 Tax=uncultured Roseibium sp. TaxID=1936171 RepID=UPI0025998684|nr:sulfotransferase family 2 domain-containing protein [uncultured Roseibium sp.]